LRLSDLTGESGWATPVLSASAGRFLVGAIGQGANVLIVGGTGSGKTTLLNALLAELGGPANRTVVIEETAELQLDELPFAVALEGRPPNVEGAGEIGLRPLVKTALRMRPRRIVVGEARGAEAFELLQAMNTGHAGSMATAHANAPRHGLERLVTMAAQAGEHLPDSTLRRMVAQTIGLVVHLALDEHGMRQVTEVWELAGLEGDQFLGHAIFAREGGTLRRTGLPSRWEQAARLGAASTPNGPVSEGEHR
jgi:pilus assembly protein CpaF